MFTRVLSIEELKQMWSELFLARQNKVSKIADHSVLSGVGYGCAKIGQKTMKEVALVEAHLFPDYAFGSQLDDVAANMGIAARFGAVKSSTYVRLVGDAGTTVIAGIHEASATNGVKFDFEDTVVLGADGYAYAKVRSQDTGEATNVDPLTIIAVSPSPAGLRYVINEYMATGGRDAEDDVTFKKRIKEGPSILAISTIACIEQAFMKINADVLRVMYAGLNTNGKISLIVATQSGASLTSPELDDLLEASASFFAITDLKPYGQSTYGVTLSNVQYQAIDMDFRVQLFNGYDPDEVRVEMQLRCSKYVDWRTWQSDDVVEWDDLLQIVKSTPGVRYVPDSHFSPSSDFAIEIGKLPRIRGFIERDMDGSIMSNSSGTLVPSYFQNTQSANYQATVLGAI